MCLVYGFIPQGPMYPMYHSLGGYLNFFRLVVFVDAGGRIVGWAVRGAAQAGNPIYLPEGGKVM